MKNEAMAAPRLATASRVAAGLAALFVNACSSTSAVCPGGCRPGAVCVDGRCALICTGLANECPQGEQCNIVDFTCESMSSGDCTQQQPLTSACGLNGAGQRQRECKDGQWVEWGPCDDPDECANGLTDKRPCGLSNSGLRIRSCANGSWSAWSACDGQAQCVDGDSDTIACGLNNRGQQTRTCVGGAWQTWDSCDDKDVCVDNTSEEDACMFSPTGSITRFCSEGRWGDWQLCENPNTPGCVVGSDDQGVALLKCPTGEQIVSIDSAHYGTPKGSCERGFKKGSCDAKEVESTVTDTCERQTPCTVYINSAAFGDPCQGRPKQLAVTFTCAHVRVCGDYVCEQGETCSTCPRDCGVCCTASNGSAEYCGTGCGPCGHGEGDCDSSSQCQSGLVCPSSTYSNGSQFGFSSSVQVCVPWHCTNGRFDSSSGEVAVDCGGPCGSNCI